MQAFDWSVLFLHISVYSRCIGDWAVFADREEEQESTLGWLCSHCGKCVNVSVFTLSGHRLVVCTIICDLYSDLGI